MRVVVIGAGPAGMMAAGQAALRGFPVTLIERNGSPGKKLAITGKGRCNLTNDCSAEEFMQNIPGDGRFLRGALSRFTPQDTRAFFETLGVPTVVERGRRVFPQSGKAADVVNALTVWLGGLGVKTLTGRVGALCIEEGVVTGVTLGNRRIDARAVIVATGGLSYPKTGSDGDGYRMAAQAGHTLVPCTPSLVPLVSPDEFCRAMQGLSLRNVTARLVSPDGKTVWEEGPGEMLFTHFGVSGPLVLSGSAHWREGLSLAVDLKPGLTEKQLDARVLRDFALHSARKLENSLGDLLHGRMIPVILDMCGFPPGKRTAEVVHTERERLVRLLKAFPVRLSGTRPVEEAVVTRGGVSTKELNPKTMASKLVRGLYFAGEVLDVDAYTGGYNLQIAWSTGFAAGTGVCPIDN